MTEEPSKVLQSFAGPGARRRPARGRPPLRGVIDTLRLPLAARALGGRIFPQLAVHDATAARLLARLGDDGSRWLQDRHSVYSVLSRTHVFRRLAAEFLRRVPTGHIINLGCGLSNYFQWLDNGKLSFTSADLPEVVALRRRLIPSRHDRQALMDLDLRRAGWWDRLRLDEMQPNGPVFLITEGLLVYLRPREVMAVLAEFGARAPAGSAFAFDAASWLAIGYAWAHPLMRYTHARFTWGLSRMDDLTRPHARLKLASSYDVMESYGWPHSVSGPMTTMMTGVPLYAVYELRVRGKPQYLRGPVNPAPT